MKKFLKTFFYLKKNFIFYIKKLKIFLKLFFFNLNKVDNLHK
jgi:hypothetical protein